VVGDALSELDERVGAQFRLQAGDTQQVEPVTLVERRWRERTGVAFQHHLNTTGGSVAEWLACWTQAQKGLGSNRSRDAVG